jgi:hypothetical protein
MSDAAQPLPPSKPQSRQGLLTANRLRRLGALNGAARYLEIGVCNGDTFLNVEFPVADAVDPRFQFDIVAFAREGARFLSKTSDDFFREDTVGQVYDLMFLDGLHTFEQCFRDFCASMAHAHERTIWLIDDTVPNDAFSIRKNMKETWRLRAAHGIKSPAWHGDVFKTLFAIHDFFPTFDYRTVEGTGNPQTIVIRSPRRDFAPRWNSLEAISRCDYMDFLDNRDILKSVSEDEAVAWAATALNAA